MSTEPRPHQVPIAIVGVSAIFPGSVDRTGFWNDILAGRDLITDVPPSHWLIEDYYDPDPSVPDMTYAKRGAFLGDIDFDTLGWGVPPNLLPQTDTVQLLALIAAKRVLEDACRATEVDRERVSVILGITSGQDLLGKMVSRLQHPIWRKSLREMGLPESEVEEACKRIASHYANWEESTFPGLLGNVVAGRIANRLDLGGTNCVTDAACASSFSAISMAVNELTLHQSDLVISGGCDTMNDIFMYMCFSKTPALSPSGDCAPFSDKADGTLLGEGLGMVALKRLDDAQRDGDAIYAVLKGVGSSSDGRSKSVYAPRPQGQASAIARAYAIAGYSSDTVELVEAHGTGTKAGDAAEFEGLKQAFGPTEHAWCALGTVKSQIGHTKAAAGAAGLFKAVMALQHKVLPPTIKIERPNPGMGIEDSAFYLNTEARPWVRGADHPRRVGVSSFGFGGSNFHLAVEEYVGPNPAGRLRTLPSELVVLTGATPAAVVSQAQQLLATMEPGMLAFLAQLTGLAFDPKQPCKLAIVAADEAGLCTKLETAIAHLEAKGNAPLQTPNGIFWSVGADAGKVAFLFPGQGSQYLKMGAGLAMTWDAARDAWDQAADLEFGPHALHDVVFPRRVYTDEDSAAQKSLLTATEWAQPAIGAHSLAMLGLLDALELRASVVGGHSFGEIIALHAAGVFPAHSALQIARRRGELMAEAASLPGSMLAVPATVDAVRAVLEQVGGDAVVANHNSPNQVVVSGPEADVAKVEAALLAKGIEPKQLSVATAFHSSVVAGSTEPFRAFLDGVEMASPKLPVYANSLADTYAEDAESIRGTLSSQIAKPVRFVEQIEAMYASGVRTFVEVGPGNVLTNLVRTILDGRDHAAISLDRKRKADVTAFLTGIAQVVVSGAELRLDALWAGYAELEDPREAEQPKLALQIRGSNYGQPYPPPEGAAGVPAPNPPRPEPEPRIVYVETSAPQSARTQEVAMSHNPQPPGSNDLWVHAFAEAQRQTAEAHAAYQAAMASSHQSYLRTVETSFATLSALAGAPVSVAPYVPAQLPQAQLPQIQAAAIPATPAWSALAPVAVAPVAVAPPIAVTPVAPAPIAAAPAPVAVAAPTAAAPVAAAVDLKTLLMDVVADKTGYPAEMLNLEMSLEGDLGIDSIKRVEILSAMREREPTLPEVDAGEMAALSTLGEIVTYMDANGSSPAAGVTAAPVAVTVDLKTLLMDVVADKTGYPAEMLNLEMSLEGDLGIDSIKRVEILSAMREREPTLPEVDAGEMAALSTLGQIVAYMDGQGADPVHPPEAHSALSSAEMGRYVLELEDRAALGLSQPGFWNAVWITGDDVFGPALAAALNARGIEASSGPVPDGARAVVYTGGLRAEIDAEVGRQVAREAFALAHRLAPTLQLGSFVTVQDTGGDFGLAGSKRAWIGHLPGLTKTAAQEWPGASTKAIDIAVAGRDPSVVAEQLADELLAGGPELEVALGPDWRRIPHSVRRDAAPTDLPLHSESVVVVSGGARGVTAATVVALAQKVRCRFVLLGRTALLEESAGTQAIHDDSELKKALLTEAKARGEQVTPASLGKAVKQLLANREIASTLTAIHAAGGEAVYVSADVTDVAALQVAFDDARKRWGHIDGLIHGAGVLADKTIAAKTEAQFDFVYDTKVRGLQALLEAAGDKLRLLVLFSSVAARCGNQGQCDYAMANELLNKLAHKLRVERPGLRVKSLGWGPWEGGMVTPALKAHFEQLRVPLIPLAVGAQMLVDEIADASGNDELVLGGEPRSEALAAEHSGPAVKLALRLDTQSHGWLNDHSIQGKPVVPVVLAMEWFARAARAARPDLVLEAIEDVKVLRGIAVDLERGTWLVVTCEEVRNGTGSLMRAEICSPDGKKHYTAMIKMTEAQTRSRVLAPTLALSPFDEPIYDGHVLFHGASFQVIDEVRGVSDDGIEAVLSGTSEKAWTGSFCTDPAAFDGGLQLALLWSKRVLGGASLPTAVSALKTYADGPASGKLTATVRGEKKSKNRAVANVVFSEADGTVYAELCGVETHLRPGEA